MENQEKIDESKVTGDEFAPGFYLMGDVVAGLKDKSFVIMGQRVELIKSLDNPDEKVKKVILTIQLADKTIIDWMSNRTSQRTIISQKGTRLNDWIGFKGKFYVENQKVGKEKRNVIYVEEK